MFAGYPIPRGVKGQPVKYGVSVYYVAETDDYEVYCALCGVLPERHQYVTPAVRAMEEHDRMHRANGDAT